MSIGSFLVSIAAFYKDKGQGFIVIAVCKGTKLNNVCQKTKHIYLSPRRFPCFCALSVQSLGGIFLKSRTLNKAKKNYFFSIPNNSMFFGEFTMKKCQSTM